MTSRSLVHLLGAKEAPIIPASIENSQYEFLLASRKPYREQQPGGAGAGYLCGILRDAKAVSATAFHVGDQDVCSPSFVNSPSCPRDLLDRGALAQNQCVPLNPVKQEVRGRPA